MTTEQDYASQVLPASGRLERFLNSTLGRSHQLLAANLKEWGPDMLEEVDLPTWLFLLMVESSIKRRLFRQAYVDLPYIHIHLGVISEIAAGIVTWTGRDGSELFPLSLNVPLIGMIRWQVREYEANETLDRFQTAFGKMPMCLPELHIADVLLASDPNQQLTKDLFGRVMGHRVVGDELYDTHMSSATELFEKGLVYGTIYPELVTKHRSNPDVLSQHGIPVANVGPMDPERHDMYRVVCRTWALTCRPHLVHLLDKVDAA